MMLERVLTGCMCVMLAMAGRGQEPEKKVPKVVPIPVPVPSLRPQREVPDPATPTAQTVTDAKTHVTFRLPGAWNLNRKDGEVSSYRLDARTAPRTAELRAVASLAFNPYPLSTFAGALFYLSVIPHSTEAACAAETTTKPDKPLASAIVGDVKFNRGKDEHGKICTEARDVAYAALRGGSCVRFDLAVNTFCGGEVSGAEEITEAQLGAIFKRMEGILDTVHFGK